MKLILYVESSPSYLRDTTDFLSKIKDIQEPLPDDSILFCFDVCKLYPSIPRDEGLIACKEALENRTNPLLPTPAVMEMIEIVLDNNNFSLGNKHYTQTDGIAIGSKLGRNFACTYMRKWDERLLQFRYKPTFYKRFIDDGIGIWTHGLDSLIEFEKYANSIHNNIKVELRWSRSRIEFLDTWLKLENGRVYTDLYVKPTDKQMYVNNNSCHPNNVKKSLAYGLGIRIKRICEKDGDYRQQRKILKTQLHKRGYAGRFIESQLKKVDILNRDDLLKYKDKTKLASDRVPLVVTYSKGLPDIRHIVRKHQPTLHKSDRMKEIFGAPPLLAFRRGRNLADTLIHTKTNRAVPTVYDSCDCKICALIVREEILGTNCKKPCTVLQDVSCKTNNIVYGIGCGKCKRTVYVGETCRSLGERITEHLRDIRYHKEKPINNHFDQGHDIRDVKICVLKKMHDDSKAHRLIWEENFIKRLNTMAPFGCNVKTNT